MATTARAELIEISFAGSTDNAEGSIDYAPGGVFSGAFVFDTDLAFPNSTGAGTGSFQEVGDPLRGYSGLVSAEVTTPLGTVYFDRALVGADDNLQIAAHQIEQFGIDPSIDGQEFGGGLEDLGYLSGLSDALFSDISGFEPTSLSLIALSRGQNDTFFSDPASLLSDAQSLSLSEFFAAGIVISFLNGEDTELALGPDDEFSIRVLGDGSGPSEVPLPGAFVFILSGLAGLRFGSRALNAARNLAQGGRS